MLPKREARPPRARTPTRATAPRVCRPHAPLLRHRPHGSRQLSPRRHAQSPNLISKNGLEHAGGVLKRPCRPERRRPARLAPAPSAPRQGCSPQRRPAPPRGHRGAPGDSSLSVTTAGRDGVPTNEPRVPVNTATRRHELKAGDRPQGRLSRTRRSSGSRPLPAAAAGADAVLREPREPWHATRHRRHQASAPGALNCLPLGSSCPCGRAGPWPAAPGRAQPAAAPEALLLPTPHPQRRDTHASVQLTTSTDRPPCPRC